MPEIDGVKLPFIPAGGLDQLKRQPAQPGRVSSETSFGEIFEEELKSVKFSSHARSRMISRDLDLTTQDMQRLQSAVELAESKGANESLIMLDEKAFIVSVDYRTVITVVAKDDMESKVVTNIDSAVFA